MEKVIDFLLNLKEILFILSSILVCILFIKKIIFGKEKILKGNTLHFKELQNIFSDNKKLGYFAIQQHFCSRLTVSLMEYIMNSPDAYSIFIYLKDASGKYEFVGNQFRSNVTKKNFILPAIGCLVSCLFFSLLFTGINILFEENGVSIFIFIIIINLCISVPLFLISFWSINETNCALKLEKLSNKIKEEEEKEKEAKKKKSDDNEQDNKFSNRVAFI